MAGRALVLGSGGVTGVAWEAGVLAALESAGVRADAWDTVIGTSAGAFVGAWFLAGRVAELDDIQTAGDPAVADRNLKAATGTLVVDALRAGRRPGLGWLPHAWTLSTGLTAVGRYGIVRGPRSVRDLGLTLHARRSGAGITTEGVQRVGDLLLTGGADDAPRWVEYLGRELDPVTHWPPGLVVTALHLASGARTTFDHLSGTPLPRAVAASTAVPLVVGPVAIDGHRYGDGGSASPTNADLAAGHDEVLVVAPVDRGTLAHEVRGLREAGARVVVLRPSATAVLGRGVTTLDPYRRAASARAGRADAARLGTLFVAP